MLGLTFNTADFTRYAGTALSEYLMPNLLGLSLVNFSSSSFSWGGCSVYVRVPFEKITPCLIGMKYRLFSISLKNLPPLRFSAR